MTKLRTLGQLSHRSVAITVYVHYRFSFFTVVSNHFKNDTGI